MRKPARRDGFALLMVLWVLVIVAFILAQLFSLGRTEAKVAESLQANARAEALADGGIYETIFRLLKSRDYRPSIGDRVTRGEDGSVSVRMAAEDGKINPNVASPQTLAALLRALGVEGDQAIRLASAIADWRDSGDRPRQFGAKLRQYVAREMDHAPPNSAFESLDELRRVMGMTPALFSALRPHLTLYSLTDPDLLHADPIVLRALQPLSNTLMRQNGQSAFTTVTISAEAHTISGATFQRVAIVRLSQSFARGYAILDWEQGE